MEDYMDRRVTPSQWVTPISWGLPPPCKQALGINYKKREVFRRRVLKISNNFWKIAVESTRKHQQFTPAPRLGLENAK